MRSLVAILFVIFSTLPALGQALPGRPGPGLAVPTASASLFGLVKPDGTSVTISGGVISANGSGGAGSATLNDGTNSAGSLGTIQTQALQVTGSTGSATLTGFAIPMGAYFTIPSTFTHNDGGGVTNSVYGNLSFNRGVYVGATNSSSSNPASSQSLEVSTPSTSAITAIALFSSTVIGIGSAGVNMVGIGFHDSNGRYVVFGLRNSPSVTGTMTGSYTTWVTLSQFNSTTSLGTNYRVPDSYWVRCVLASGTFTVSWSPDGQNWLLLGTQANNFLTGTITTVGPFVWANTASLNTLTSVYSFTATTP